MHDGAMAAHLRRATFVVALLVTACSGAHAASDPLGRGSWSGARTTRDPKVVLITFVGGAPYRRGEPCTVRYRATTRETTTKVEVRFTATPGKGGTATCTAVGYFRSVRVRLVRPLGGRAVVEAAFDRTQPVFDGSHLLRPTWLPRRYRLQYETGREDTWTRTWGVPIPKEAATSNRCVPSRPTLELTEGPAAMLTNWRANELTVDGNRPVRKTTGTLYRASDGHGLRLNWSEGDRGYSLATAARCVDDTPITEAQFLRIAAGLRPKP